MLCRPRPSVVVGERYTHHVVVPQVRTQGSMDRRLHRIVFLEAVVSAKDRMLQMLSQADGPVCDDCVWQPAGMKYRQQANSRGRELAAAGLIRRGQGTCVMCGKHKTVSAPTGAEPLVVVPSTADERPWHWEGNVQAALVAHLSALGWRVVSTANTATKEAGVDVKAVDPDGSEWWITVKGYPERKPGKRANPANQARHWFSHALFDVVCYRTERSDINIGVAVPGPFQTYERLVQKAAWLSESAPFTLFVVAEDGSVGSG